MNVPHSTSWLAGGQTSPLNAAMDMNFCPTESSPVAMAMKEVGSVPQKPPFVAVAGTSLRVF